MKRLEDGAIVVDPYTGTPLWDGSPPDLGLAVEWFLRARPLAARRAGLASALFDSAVATTTHGGGDPRRRLPRTAKHVGEGRYVVQASDQDGAYVKHEARSSVTRTLATRPIDPLHASRLGARESLGCHGTGLPNFPSSRRA